MRTAWPRPTSNKHAPSRVLVGVQTRAFRFYGAAPAGSGRRLEGPPQSEPQPRIGSSCRLALASLSPRSRLALASLSPRSRLALASLSPLGSTSSVLGPEPSPPASRLRTRLRTPLSRGVISAHQPSRADRAARCPRGGGAAPTRPLQPTPPPRAARECAPPPPPPVGRRHGPAPPPPERRAPPRRSPRWRGRA